MLGSCYTRGCSNGGRRFSIRQIPGTGIESLNLFHQFYQIYFWRKNNYVILIKKCIVLFYAVSHSFMFRCFYNTILFSLHETSNLHFTPLHLSKASHCRSHRPPPPPPRWDLARRHVLCISYCDSHLVLKWNSRLIIPTLWFCRGAGAVLSRSYTSNNLKRRSKHRPQD